MKLKNSSKKMRKYAFLIISFIFLITILFFLLSYFKLQTIEIIGPRNQINAISDLEGKNLIFMNESDLRRKLLVFNDWIEDLKLEKKYPNKLKIFIQPKEIEAILLKEDKGFLLTKDGTILKTISKDSIPDGLTQIEEKNDLKKISSNDVVIKAVLEIIHQLKENNQKVKVVMIDRISQEAIFVLPDETEVIISFTKNNPNLAASLQIIITRFRIEGKQASKIDFRFEKPIVTLLNGGKVSP